MALTILVTGGAGYIGSILVPELLNLGHRVIVLDNFSYNQNSLNHVVHYKNFEVIKADVRDKTAIEPLIKNADVVIPLAALVGAPLCKLDPVGATTINHDSVIMLLKLLSADQVVLMPTTNSAYGSGDKNNFCTEDSSLNPISQYAIEKVKVEQALMDHANAISFRLATVFGMSPRMRIDLLVNDFTYRAFHDHFIGLFEADFKRNYIHVRDVVRVFIHGLTHLDSMKGNIYNVGLSNANVSKRELCAKIKEQIPELVFVEASVGKDPDQRNYIVSNRKIEATGFVPEYSLDMGITELLKGYRMLKNSRYSNV
jgi:nucleoside-diphosphate-sugar epimerase